MGFLELDLGCLLVIIVVAVVLATDCRRSTASSRGTRGCWLRQVWHTGPCAGGGFNGSAQRACKRRPCLLWQKHRQQLAQPCTQEERW
jgi:hypothetical protein